MLIVAKPLKQAEIDMNVKISGASKTEGKIEVQQQGNFVYPAGEYLMEIVEVSYKDREDRNLHAFTHKFMIIQGPLMGNKKSPTGKNWMWFNNVPKESHPKFSENWFGRALGAEIALANAVGLEVVNDNVPVDELMGKVVKVTLGIQDGTDKNGKDQKENVVLEFKAE